MRVFLTIFAGAVLISAQPKPNTPALDGNDPVLLTEGKDVDGLESLTVQRGRFLYRFASAETRDRFNKDPERYAIQLEGACARMGPPTTGDPSAYVVYNGRIYIMGSQECYKRFKEDPKKYLEAEQPKAEWNSSPEARAKGRALLAKALTAMGGADRFKSIQNYVETRTAETPRGKQKMELFALLPESIGMETSNGEFRGGTLVTPEGTFRVFRGEGQRLPDLFASIVRSDWSHDLLAILTATNRPDFDLFGDAATVTVKLRGVISTLSVNPSSGIIDAITYHGRGIESAFGEMRIELSDYREIAGYKLPFRAAGKFGGQDYPQRSWAIESYQFNSPDVAARLKAPAKIRE
jgi:YHS domain-containing protein